jgi:hypothetical protein
MKNEQEDRITPAQNSADPYSPRKTCCGRHHYAAITSGYHFQQGFDEMKDGFDQKRSWILSPGMFGKWLPTAAAGRLAAKHNTDKRQIDLSIYDWIGAGAKYSPLHKVKSVSCGACHPDGGPMEYGCDAQGRAAGFGSISGAVFSYNHPGAGPGDRQFASGIWNFSRRSVVSFVWSDRRLFTSDGRMNGQVVKKAISSKNCLQCHSEGEAKNAGTLHTPEYDAHVKAGLMCTDCHVMAGRRRRKSSATRSPGVDRPLSAFVKICLPPG